MLDKIANKEYTCTYNGFDNVTSEKVNGSTFKTYAYDSHNRLAEYVYDAWGNHTIITDIGGIGTLNPFRYRGYYFDTETGLYYLKSRYYDPQTGRFINADSYVSTETGQLGYNMFAYCNNSPVVLFDNEGKSPTAIVTAIVTLAVFMPDIYQLIRNDEKKITYKGNGDGQGGEISYSANLHNPLMQYGYAVFLKYFHKEGKKDFKGTISGFVHEWQIHNIGYRGFSALAMVTDIVGIDFINKWAYEKADRCQDFTFGNTIFNDTEHGFFSFIMKATYALRNRYAFLIDAIIHLSSK